MCAATILAGDFHAYRTVVTEPSYSLAKVKRMIRGIKRDQEDNQRISAAGFSALTFEEKFTYVMLHGEDFNQNCDGGMTIAGEAHKIFSYPADPFPDDMAWSEQQRTFLTKNRHAVIKLLHETISNRSRVGANLKSAIVELNGHELIPDLISAYNRDRRDNDVLTVLMLLMKDGGYGPFMYTPVYMKMYGDEDASYRMFLDANAANRKLILDYAMAYYRKPGR